MSLWETANAQQNKKSYQDLLYKKYMSHISSNETHKYAYSYRKNSLRGSYLQ